MPRKGPAQRRELVADPIYRSLLVTQLTNKVMLHGKKSTAEKIVYDALAMIEKKTGSEPIATLKRAIENVKPPLEVRSRRVGGATYQVPVEVKPRRATTLAIRWVVDYARARREKTMAECLANELMDAANGLGASMKKRDDMQKMASPTRPSRTTAGSPHRHNRTDSTERTASKPEVRSRVCDSPSTTDPRQTPINKVNTNGQA